MDSPLRGNGIPRLETTEVFVSAYLDRLIGIDEKEYKWEAILYFFITWSDSAAFDTMINRTTAMWSQPGYPCTFPCRSVVQTEMCCDGLYIPSLFFTNAHGFSQDREVLDNIYCEPASAATGAAASCMREVRVHGTFYQPMTFRHYPFDAQDLVVELRFYDTSDIFTQHPAPRAAFWGGAFHPGVDLLASSSGKRLYTYGQGDDANDWGITDLQIYTFTVQMGQWFESNAGTPSHARDPLPLAPAPGDTTSGWTDINGSSSMLYSGIEDKMLAVLITVERFWKPALINSVLPVLLVFVLGMLTFVLPEADLANRLQVTVTLFLALTAVQFVLSGSLPSSSYVVPTQQLVLATYLFLLLLALEAILVYNIVMRHHNRELAKRRTEAYRRYCQLRDAGKLRGGANPRLPPGGSAGEGGPSGLGRIEELSAASAASMEEGAESPASPGSPASLQHAGASDVPQGLGVLGHLHHALGRAASKPPRQAPAALSHADRRGSMALRQLTADEALGEYVGHLVDNAAAAALAVGYVVTAVVLLCTQSGYIDLFADGR